MKSSATHRRVFLGLALSLCLAVLGAGDVGAAGSGPADLAQAAWPMHRFGPAQDGFNPNEHTLNRQNVGKLTLQATTSLAKPYTADAPLISDGVMYVTGYGLQDLEYLYAYDLACVSAKSGCVQIWSALVGFNSQPRIAVGDGMVFVASDAPHGNPEVGRLWAFRAGCGTSAAVCSPAWIADLPETQVLDAPPTVTDGLVFVATSSIQQAHLYAFDVHCGTAGASCSPRWKGPIAVAGRGAAAVADGIVYIADYGTVSAFDINCGIHGATCAPLWKGGVGIADAGAAVADGKVFVTSGGQMYAFAARCSRAVCTPLWSGGDFSDGASAPAIAGGTAYMVTNKGVLYAFPLLCDSRCRPLWTGIVSDDHVFAGSTPAVANGVVYVTWSSNRPERWLQAFPAACHMGCLPLWTGTAGYFEFLGPAVAGGKLFVGGGPFSGPGQVFVFGLA